jgi:metallophosphoesterase (TIGR00282 family)
MNILVVGDVIGQAGVKFIRDKLSGIKKLYGASFCVINGENSANGNGINVESSQGLLLAGADVITLGNHTFDKSDVYKLFDEKLPIVRPANYPPGTAGEGYLIIDTGAVKICVISLLGRVNLNNLDCPFRCAQELILKVKDRCDIILVDFHAEATSEKIAMGYFLDGKATAVWGTHTHVQTADERILPGGSAYITDIGMTGPVNSVIGVKKEIIISKFLTNIHQKFEISDNPINLNGIILTIDDKTHKATAIERISIS